MHVYETGTAEGGCNATAHRIWKRFMGYIVMRYIVIASIVMACILMAYIVMACVVMACIGMTYKPVQAGWGKKLECVAQTCL